MCIYSWKEGSGCEHGSLPPAHKNVEITLSDQVMISLKMALLSSDLIVDLFIFYFFKPPETKLPFSPSSMGLVGPNKYHN